MSFRAKAHMYVYKKSNGRLFAKMGNAPVCLLTTTGRTSRLARTVPLVYLVDSNRIVLVASNLGGASDPQWYRNIVADQNVTLEIEGDTRAMHAVPAPPAERERLWPLAVAQYSRYGEEAKRTDREFPGRHLHLGDVMYETEDDVATVQQLLDDTYARIGEHMKSIHTPERRVAAHDLGPILRGVRVLDLATVTANCEPRVGPVDGLFFRGRFHFGSGDNSVRFAHIRKRPPVSACHTVGETFAVIVHGRAVEIDIDAPEQAPFLAYVREVYPTWDEWYPDEPAPYAFIEPSRMYAYAFEPSVVEQLKAPSE